jgi:hypothetical protein
MISSFNETLETVFSFKIRHALRSVFPTTPITEVELDALRAFGTMWSQACAFLSSYSGLPYSGFTDAPTNPIPVEEK